MKKTTIIETIVILFIILFLYTGISKILDYPIFKEQIELSPILGSISKPVAVLIPTLELMIVTLLIVPRWRLKGLYTSFILMAAFTIYIFTMLRFNTELPCSCGGIISELSWEQHIALNGVLLFLALTAIILEKKVEKIHQQKISTLINV